MSEKICGIYKIENKKTHQVYIGQSKDVNYRWREHKWVAKRGDKKILHSRLYSAMYQHIDDFEFSVVEQCSSDKLDEREIYWIAFYDSTVPYKGYNILKGGKAIGDVCRILTDSQKKEIAKLLSNSNLTQTEIANKYNVDQSTISWLNIGKYQIDGITSFPIRDREWLAKKNGSTKKMNNCCSCGCACDAKAEYCLSCYKEKLRVDRENRRPSKEYLSNLIRETSFVEIGKMFNVTDNAIRKWCKLYNLPFRKKDISAWKMS